jgi:hypothetical protein
MPKTHIVQRGEGMSAIAYRHGFFWETLWDLPENAELRARRSDPEFLVPGDAVYIPDLDATPRSCSTGQSHQFKRKGVPAWVRVRLLDGDQPMANVPWVVETENERREGTTDGDGWLRTYVSPDSRRVKVTLPRTGDVMNLEVGTIAPHDTVEGVQRRLANLGLYTGEVDGAHGEPFSDAVRAFQRAHGLPETGEADAATREKVRDVHGE